MQEVSDSYLQNLELKGRLFTSRFQVYYEDTDALGVVYYANYLKFAERARTDALVECGIKHADLAGGLIIRKVECRYFTPARLGDIIEISSKVTDFSKMRLQMQQDMTLYTPDVKQSETDKPAKRKLFVSMEVEIVYIDKISFKPIPIPFNALKELL